MKVTSPDQVTWRVTRRWVPWRRRIRDTTDRLPDLPEGGVGDDPVSMVVGLLLLVVMLPFLLLMLAAAVELVLILAVMPVAILGRVALGRRWTVEVRRGWALYADERVGDWRTAGERIREIAQDIELGRLPRRDLEQREDAAERA